MLTITIKNISIAQTKNHYTENKQNYLTLNWWLIDWNCCWCKNLDLNRKTILLEWRSNWKRICNACISSEFVQEKKLTCYVITAKRASHYFVPEATNNSKNINACLKHETKATRRCLNLSGDEPHTPLPRRGEAEAKENEHKTKKNNFKLFRPNTNYRWSVQMSGISKWCMFRI